MAILSPGTIIARNFSPQEGDGDGMFVIRAV
jgi:hypothetical protein